MHDAAKVVLGGAHSSIRDVECFAGSPATFLAGLRVCLDSNGDLSLDAADGMAIGISKGKSLSDTSKTDVIRAGMRIPVRSHLKRSTGTITVTNYANLVSGTDDTVTIGATEFTAQAGAATPGDATFQAASSNDATATSLAAQINAHATAGALVYAVAAAAVVTLYARVEGAGTGHDVAVAYTDNDTNVGITLAGLSAGKLDGGSDVVADADHIVAGLKMYINDETGKADVAMSGFSTVSDALYVAGPKTGIAEDGSEVCAALVDMQGGL